MRTVLLLTAALVLTADPAAAQLLRGSVVEEGSRAPVEGAMVVVLDDGGGAVTRILTDAGGAFAVGLPHPGYYRIRVDRIGYASLTTDPFAVPVEGAQREIFMPVRAIELTGLDVEGSRRCEVRPEEGRVTARVWEEARKALAATAWTQNQGVYRYTLLNYERELDQSGRVILDESRRFRRGRYQAPFASLPGDDLVRGGFVRPDSSEEGTIYYAPDAEALLSDSFLDTHCMKVRPGEDGLLALEFEPVEDRNVPEIRGVLWVDGATARLRKLEFGYENLRRDVGEPGGAVVFGGLPNGTWIVREWRIRMPLMGYRGRTGIVRKVGYQEEGGVVWRVSDRDGAILLEAGTATLAGSVVDSLGRRPLPGAVVQSLGTGVKAVTEEDGSFLMPGLAEGLHRLRVRHPALDSLGLVPPPVTVEARLGEMTSARISLPGAGQALMAACGGSPRASGSAILFGRVLDAEGRPAGAVAVRLVLPDAVMERLQVLSVAAPPGPETGGGARWRRAAGRIETETDGRGIFLLCDVPEGSRIGVEVHSSDGRSVRETTDIPRGARVATVRIFLERG